ncbi:MAG: hypothetical protein QOJ98_3109 [Acidobacteriota bacterium]|nr:hypothetical protein [Acidobacteriota bacterium]
MDVIKVQTTLKGYNAWVIQRLMELKREPMADITNYVFTRWIDDNPDFLARFGLTLEHFNNDEEARGKVKKFDRNTSGREET